MANILKKSLKTRVFVIFLVASVAAVSLLGGAVYFTGKNILQTQIFDSYTAIGQSYENAMLEFLDNTKSYAETLENDYYFAGLYEKLLKGGADSAQVKQTADEYLQEVVKFNPLLQEIFVIDLSGKVILSSNEKNIGADEAGKKVFEEGKKGYHFESLFKSDVTGQDCFLATMPFHSNDGKTTLGVFAVRLNPDKLTNIVSHYDGLGKTGETYVVNNENYFITGSRFSKETALKQKADTEPVNYFRQKGENMTGIYKDYRGQNVLGVSNGDLIAKQYPDLGWVVLTEIDQSEAFRPIQKLGFIILGIGAIIGISMGIIAYFIAGGIVAPLQKVVNIVRKVGEGDLRDNVETSRAVDEIGTLNNSIKLTVESLRMMVVQTLSVAERVSASSQELSSSAQEMNATTEEVSSTVQQIAKGTETQAQRVDETQKVMEQMSTSVMQVSKGAQDAALQAIKSSESAKKSGESTKETREKLISISDAIIGSATDVKKLNERAEQIGEIVGVITNIADQTNLLALNAAIEAARAGEYGRGFAVVAEEVRKLAEGSAKASDEIRRLITDVQKETNQAVGKIEGVAKDAASVRDITKKVMENLEEIIKNTEGVSTMIEQVSAASQEQASGAKQVSTSVSEIASIAEETASATEEASASTEEMTASMEEMAASAQELADMGLQLRDLVAKFKIGENQGADYRPQSSDRRPQTGKVVLDVAEKVSKLAKLKEHALAMKKKMGHIKGKDVDV